MLLDRITEDLNKEFDIEKLPFRRNLTAEEVQKLQKAASLAFSAAIHPQVIEKIMHYCYFVERRIKGRAAGNIEDLIIRYLTRYFASFVPPVDEQDHVHLEIGVLFGATTIYSCHSVAIAGKDMPIVVIDPFEGYYGQELDIITKLPVDEETFWANIDTFDFRNRVRLLKGFSTDESIIGYCRDLRLLSLIIDGDHTYAGVKEDWLTYAPLVVPGGYVIFDDYNNHVWPEVTTFVNEVLSNLNGKWDVSLVFGNSLVLKRTAVVDDEKMRNEDRLFNGLKDKEMLIKTMMIEDAKKDEQLKQKDEQLKQKDEQLKQKDEQLKQKIKQLQRLYNTRSWRITEPLRRVANVFGWRKKSQ